MKRGQVTAFFIIGLLVIMTVAVVSYIQWDYIEGNWLSKLGFYNSVPEEVEPVYNQILQGLEDTALVIIPENAWQSGYYNLGENVNGYNTTYYLYRGRNLMPSKKFIENQLEIAMNENLPLYVDYASMSSDFLVVPEELPETKVSIEDQSIIFDVVYPHTVSKANETFNFKNFRYVSDIRYGELLDALGAAVELQSEIEDMICLDCLLDINNDYGVTFELYNPVDYEVEFVMFADDVIVRGRTLQFVYAARIE